MRLMNCNTQFPLTHKSMERKQANSADTHPFIPIGAKSLYCSRKQRNKSKTIGQSIVITKIYGEIPPTTQT